MSPKEKEVLLQLKMALNGITPLIWRRVIVSSEMTLLDFHHVIQLSMGWEESHLFLFKVGHLEFVYPDHWEEDAYKFQDAERATLGDLIPRYVPEGKSFRYTYDMGDGWNHEIKVEKILTESGHNPPYLVTGARACPPEDVGGIPGYAYFLEAINDPQHEEHESYMTWIGGSFDPDDFDPERINQEFKTYLKEQSLNRTSYWRAGDGYFSPGNFYSKWTETISLDDRLMAEYLPLRKNLVAMLKYLQENKVVGTKATGNFPRKHIRAMAEGFVQPFPVDIELYGEVVFKFVTEDEIPEMVFLHVFSNLAGLIFGGENYRWRVTELGEQFLEVDPVAQVWYLTEFWMTQVNWFYQYYWEVDESLYSRDFVSVTFQIFRSYEPGQTIPLSKLIHDFDKVMPGWVVSQSRENSPKEKERFLVDVIITTFERLGLINIIEEESELAGFWHVTSFEVTEYGQDLLNGIFEAHKRAFTFHSLDDGELS